MYAWGHLPLKAGAMGRSCPHLMMVGHWLLQSLWRWGEEEVALHW